MRTFIAPINEASERHSGTCLQSLVPSGLRAVVHFAWRPMRYLHDVKLITLAALRRLWSNFWWMK